MRKPTTITPARVAYNAARAEIYAAVYAEVKAGKTWAEATQAAGVGVSCVIEWHKAQGLPSPSHPGRYTRRNSAASHERATPAVVPYLFYTDEMCRHAYEQCIEHDTDDTEQFGVPPQSVSVWRLRQGLPTRLELKKGKARRNLQERFDVAIQSFSEGVDQVKACADAGISVGAFRRIRKEIGFVPSTSTLWHLREKRQATAS